MSLPPLFLTHLNEIPSHPSRCTVFCSWPSFFFVFHPFQTRHVCPPCRHHKRRIIKEKLVNELANVLPPGALVYLSSDVPELVCARNSYELGDFGSPVSTLIILQSLYLGVNLSILSQYLCVCTYTHKYIYIYIYISEANCASDWKAQLIYIYIYIYII